MEEHLKTRSQRRENWMRQQPVEELVRELYRSAVLAHDLLSGMSESSYTTPVDHAAGVAAFSLLHAVVGSNTQNDILIAALCNTMEKTPKAPND